MPDMLQIKRTMLYVALTPDIYRRGVLLLVPKRRQVQAEQRSSSSCCGVLSSRNVPIR